MNRRRLIRYALFTGLSLIVIGGITYLYTRIRTPSPTHPALSTEAPDSQDAAGRADQPLESQVAHLYFAAREKSFLVAEERTLVASKDPVIFGETIIKALIGGPEQGLTPTLPNTTGLRGLFVTEAGVAYVDLTDDIIANHPGGSETELMTIYSIVNSLVLNIPRIKRVKILINGRESMTLGGHLDLRYPFKANMLLVR